MFTEDGENYDGMYGVSLSTASNEKSGSRGSNSLSSVRFRSSQPVSSNVNPLGLETLQEGEKETIGDSSEETDDSNEFAIDVLLKNHPSIIQFLFITGLLNGKVFKKNKLLVDCWYYFVRLLVVSYSIFIVSHLCYAIKSREVGAESLLYNMSGILSRSMSAIYYLYFGNRVQEVLERTSPKNLFLSKYEVPMLHTILPNMIAFLIVCIALSCPVTLYYLVHDKNENIGFEKYQYIFHFTGQIGISFLMVGTFFVKVANVRSCLLMMEDVVAAVGAEGEERNINNFPDYFHFRQQIKNTGFYVLLSDVYFLLIVLLNALGLFLGVAIGYDVNYSTLLYTCRSIELLKYLVVMLIYPLAAMVNRKGNTYLQKTSFLLNAETFRHTNLIKIADVNDKTSHYDVILRLQTLCIGCGSFPITYPFCGLRPLPQTIWLSVYSYILSLLAVGFRYLLDV